MATAPTTSTQNVAMPNRFHAAWVTGTSADTSKYTARNHTGINANWVASFTTSRSTPAAVPNSANSVQMMNSGNTGLINRCTRAENQPE